MKRFFTLLLVFFSLFVADAQKKKQEGETTQAPPAPPRQNSIESKTSGLKKYPGYFDFWVDEKQDKVFLLIDKFDSEFMYVESLTAGVGSNDIGLDRNQLGKERVVKFERRGPKVLLTEVNYGYRANSENKMERLAVEQAFAQSVLWDFRLLQRTMETCLLTSLIS